MMTAPKKAYKLVKDLQFHTKDCLKHVTFTAF